MRHHDGTAMMIESVRSIQPLTAFAAGAPPETGAAGRSRPVLSRGWVQALGILAVWLYVVALHFSNDGLWFSGGAARHAMNGFFWWDFFTTLPRSPSEFALRYYARYPIIDPLTYPPFFYLLEGIGFRLLGPSPYVAKGLVLGFTLLAAFYVQAWLRRWVSEEAGWGAALLVLQPAVIELSNTIMLNVPAMALACATLYHARYWLDVPSWRRFWPVAVFALIGVVTYFPTGLVYFVVPAWIIAEGRGASLLRPKVWTFALLLATVLLPMVLFVAQWGSPVHFLVSLPDLRELMRLHRWVFYLEYMPRMFTPWFLVLLPLSVVIGFSDGQRRREARFAFLWFAICYVALCFFGSREPRYATVLFPPCVILVTIGLLSVAGRLPLPAPRYGTSPFTSILACVLFLHLVSAARQTVREVSGFKEIARFFEQAAPNDRIFYEGDNHGVFGFYLRAGDPTLHRGLVRGSKLLYAAALYEDWRLTERVSSPAEVVEVLRTECGCTWIAVEGRTGPDAVAAVRYLREAVKGPEFELVKSFPVAAPQSTQVDVYRFLLPTRAAEEILLPFPILGDGKSFSVKPLDAGP